jgi:CheY-like chemotaxis protein
MDDRHMLRFSVIDSGIGISAEDQGRLFSRFTQVDSSTTRRFGGTGLGLAICKQLAGMMGGDIGVESETGRGSTFWFTARLLRADNVAEDGAPRAKDRMVADKPLRILIAEDNSANQKVAVAMLKRLGHAVDVVGNGVEAVNALRGIRYDLVLMDLHMPDMDGIAATKTIRAFGGEVSRIPIVAMTADALNGAIERCLDAGMDDYVAKPIDADELETVISRAYLRSAAKIDASGGATALSDGAVGRSHVPTAIRWRTADS